MGSPKGEAKTLGKKGLEGQLGTEKTSLRGKKGKTIGKKRKKNGFDSTPCDLTGDEPASLNLD